METEEQQVEELKRWWKENGRTIVVGVVLGLGGVFGWNAWQARVQGLEEEASGRYEQLMESVNARQWQQARAEAQSLVQDFPDSGYAVLASLLAARGAVAEGDTEDARRHLRWTVDHGEAIGVHDLARVRIARLQIAEGKPEDALGTLDQVTEPSFAAQAAEVRGEALLALGREDEARAAFEQALGAADMQPGARARVQVKLDDLGHQDLWK